MFPVAMSDTVCAKLNDCGIADDFAQLLCTQLAKGISGEDLEERVKSGECSYNRAAAARCLDSISNLSCDAHAGDFTAWLEEVSQLRDCQRAYTCN